MSANLTQYLQNQLSRAPILLRGYIEDTAGKPYIKRRAYDELKRLIDTFLRGNTQVRMVAIPGLRGVGKTTLLAQLYTELYPKFQEHLLFLSVDQIINLLNTDLYSTLEEYQRVLGVSFEKLTSPVILFIDEIHFDPKWQATLKAVFDRSKQVFVCCTGSSALSLQATPDLARRLLFKTLYPLDFVEYVQLKQYYHHSAPIKTISNDTTFRIPFIAALCHQSSAQAAHTALIKLQRQLQPWLIALDPLEIQEFLQYGSMPFTLGVQSEHSYTLMNELIDRVIQKDLATVETLSSDTLQKVKHILFMVASSDQVSFTSLAKSLDSISLNTLQDVFAALERAEMLLRIYPYGSATKKMRQPSKFTFMSPALRYTLLVTVDGMRAFDLYKGKYLEDIVALTLSKLFGKQVFYDSARGGADFVIHTGKKKIVLEVGFGAKGVKQVQQTMRKLKANYGILISEQPLRLLTEQNIVSLPLQQFLLLA